ncbi:hypothetical protein [uncultured Selenomonas sp.]|uniref:hypothetical protein n=1 Tax=uncultured Selenomonas sp. TaxID=159275 RepID=UPI0025FC6327|nr:hypothetical protein [uncultured Selenomonas sp.]
MNSDKTLIVGSSHVVRLRHAFQSHLLPNDGQYVCFGFPGTPLWSKTVFQQVQKAVATQRIEKIVLFLPDLRFGNLIPDELLFQEPLTAGQYTHIQKAGINLKKDLALAWKTLSALERYFDAFKIPVHVLCYDLFFRIVYDAAYGRPHNPLFSLDHFECWLDTC